jgi:hypothetical protein
MTKLRDLIRAYLVGLLQEAAFKAFVRGLLGEVQPFDPDAVQPELTAQQRQWIEDVLAELNAP